MSVQNPDMPETFEIILNEAFEKAVRQEKAALRRVLNDAMLALIDAAYALEESKIANDAPARLTNTLPGEPSLLEEEEENAVQEWAQAESCLEALSFFEDHHLSIAGIQTRYIHSGALKQSIDSIAPDNTALQQHLLQRLFERARTSDTALFTYTHSQPVPQDFKVIINEAFKASLKNRSMLYNSSKDAAKEAFGEEGQDIESAALELKRAKEFEAGLELLDRIYLDPDRNIQAASKAITTITSSELRKLFSSVADEAVQERLMRCVFDSACVNTNRAALYL